MSASSHGSGEVLGKAVLDLTVDWSPLDRGMDKAKHKVDNDSKDMGDSIGGHMSNAFSKIGSVVDLAKFPALVAGAGAAAQAVGALAGGAVALGSALAPLAGAYAGFIGVYAALGQAAGVAKLAFSGIDKALGGDAKALAALSPSAKAFVKDLQGAKKEAKGLQTTAQKGLFPGLEAALKNVMPLISQIKPIIGDTAKVLGGLAKQASKVVVGDFPKIKDIAQNNIGVIKNLGSGAIDLGHAFIVILHAAIPLVTWFGQLGAKLGAFVSKQVDAADKAGKLNAFFAKTHTVMSQLGQILSNVAHGFGGIASAAAPLGNQMLSDLVKLTAKFQAFTQSAKGQNAIKQFFVNIKGPLYQIFGLVGDIAKAFISLTQQKGVGGMIQQIRPLVPVLQSVVQSTTAAFGPVVVHALTQVATLYGHIAGSNGPLVLLVTTLGDMAQALSFILDHVPGLNTLVVTLLGVVSVNRLMTAVLGPVIQAFSLAIAAIVGEGAAAETTGLQNLGMRASLIATAIAMRVQAAATIALSVAQRILNITMLGFPLVWIVAAIAAVIAIVILAIKHWDDIKKVISAAWTAIKDATITAANAVVNAVTAAWNTIKAATDAVWTAIQAVVELLWTAIVFYLKNLNPIGFVVAHWDGIKNATVTIWNAIKSFITTVWTTIKNLVILAAGAVVSTVKTAWNDAKTATVNIASAIVTWVGGFPGKVKNAIDNVIGLVKGVANDAFQGFKNAASDKVDGIITWASGVPGKIKNAIGDLSSTLYSEGRALISGLARGILDEFAGLLEKVKGFANKIKSLKGPIDKDRVLLVDEGKAIIQGLGAGMTGEFDKLKREIAGYAPSIQATLSGSIGQSGAGGSTHNGPILNIEEMHVTDKFDEMRLASNLGWKVATG